jgi:nucleotide-binding universal stress UspA family protein
MVINGRITFDHILCPTSLSAESDEALRYAIALTKTFASTLDVCYCLESTAESDDQFRRATKELEASVRSRIRPLGSQKWSWTTNILVGEPATAIVREAADRRVDLIVMRSRRRPHAAALLGSTAEAVCRTAPCPVLVTHPQEQMWAGLSTNEISMERVLVAYDYSSDAELALSYGLSLALEYGAELHLLHVIAPTIRQESSEISLLQRGLESDFHRAAQRLQRVISTESIKGCRLKLAVREGQPYREVLAYSEEQNIDLLCMGASGTGFGMRALFGSNADRVLRQAPCPVLIARPLKPAVNHLVSTENQAEINNVSIPRLGRQQSEV